MYTQKGDMGGVIFSNTEDEDQHKLEQKSEHDKWKIIRKNKPRTNYRTMSYWQVVSHCTIL